MEAGQCKPVHRYRKLSSNFVSKLIRKCEHNCAGFGHHTTVGGTSYYQNLISTTSVSVQVLSSASASGYPMPTLQYYPFPPPVFNPAMIQAPSTATIKDLVELLTLNKKDFLPGWNPAKINRNPLQWHEWYGQFNSAIDCK